MGIGKAGMVLAALICAAAAGSRGESMKGAVNGRPAKGDSEDKGSSRFLASQDECRDLFADVAEKVIPGVVSIFADRNEAMPSRRGRDGIGLGSGVIVGADGMILTNHHVVEAATALRVRLSDGREFAADIVASDKSSDLAIIRPRGNPGYLASLPLGDSDKLRVGSWVVAVGSPYGLSESVTTGIVSAKGRKGAYGGAYGGFIQTDAAINPGNSGGALVNLKGELIGINTAIVSRSGGNQGIGMAIPSNLAAGIMKDLVKDGAVTRGWLGLSVQTLDAGLAAFLELRAREGALVTSVLRGGPAEAAGLKRGDLILSMDGKAIRDAGELVGRVAEAKPGRKVDLTLKRGIKTLEVTVGMGKKPADRDGIAMENGAGPGVDRGNAGYESDSDETGAVGKPRIGLRVAEADGALRRRYRIGAGKGVVVLAVEPGGLGRGAGIQVGDLIVEANRRAVATPQDLKASAAKVRLENGKLLLLVKRGEETFYAGIRFDSK